MTELVPAFRDDRRLRKPFLASTREIIIIMMDDLGGQVDQLVKKLQPLSPEYLWRVKHFMV